MKTENLKKLAEVIVDEAIENCDTPSIENYYNVLDYEDAEQLDKFFEEQNETLWDDEWYNCPSAQYLDIWAGKFAKVVKNHKPVEEHWVDGKQIVDKYEEERWTPFIEENKKSIEQTVAFYAYNSSRFSNNLLSIFKDYVDMDKIAKMVNNDCGTDLEDEELAEQFKNGEALC